MTLYETLFALTSVAMPFWLLMILLPSWRVTRLLASLAVFPLYLAVLYAVGLVTAIGDTGFGFIQDFGSAEGVIRLLSHPDFALLAWIHLLCFDLAIGHSIYRDNMEHHYVPRPVQSILLFLVLMFGPFGWLCYLAIRRIRRTKAAQDAHSQ
ncbi:ABA4-like family protein [Desmospora profundinema]|uniref:DUF4281 domain-containing protein n=1 Tax=Desmospora profundinema TaxID=1571184 RepID=A0ABU1IRZ2_9BACL|nr:ABA4-like family protein [Desmospora profundinema]MDR6227317.1 hypothetical protein [Desmospora profundinema]